MDSRIQETVAELVTLLVEKQYTNAETLTHGIRLTSNEMATAITDYGRTLTNPPGDAWTLMIVIPVRNSSPQRWSVVMPLWTVEEGRSDLSLECTAIQKGESILLELDDIHVL